MYGTNLNPKIYQTTKEIDEQRKLDEQNENIEDEIDAQEIFDLIKDLPDPEHPLTLEQLGVVKIQDIYIDKQNKKIDVYFSPTIPNCSSASFIGLFLKVRLMRSVDGQWQKNIYVKEGTHEQEKQLNKQLNDKQRVYAATENQKLNQSINECLRRGDINIIKELLEIDMFQ